MEDWILVPRRQGQRRADLARVTLAWRQVGASSNHRSLSAYFNIPKAIVAELGWKLPGWGLIEASADRSRIRVRLSAKETRETYRLGNKDGCATTQAFLEWVQSDRRPAEAIEHRVVDGALVLALPAWARPAAVDKAVGTTVDKQPAIVDKAGADADKSPLALPPAPPNMQDQAAPAAPNQVKWTSARNDVLRRLYPGGATGEQLAAEVNKLPGEPATPSQCLAQAGNIGLRRLVRADSRQAPAVAGGEPPRPGRERKDDAPRQKDAAPPTARDELEAKVELRKGKDARLVADEFGIGLNIVSRWASEVRDEARGRAA